MLAACSAVAGEYGHSIADMCSRYRGEKQVYPRVFLLTKLGMRQLAYRMRWKG